MRQFRHVVTLASLACVSLVWSGAALAQSLDPRLPRPGVELLSPEAPGIEGQDLVIPPIVSADDASAEAVGDGEEALPHAVAPDPVDLDMPDSLSGNIAEPKAAKGVRQQSQSDSAHDGSKELSRKSALADTGTTGSESSTVNDSTRHTDRSAPSHGADGSLSYRYEIDVPSFRGVEPDLTLNYNSGRKTKLVQGYQGWLGYGWGLNGLDTIERQRPRGGVPAFNAEDVYVLNGVELFPCATGSAAPSCISGGNHSTEVESFRRIRKDATTNIWEVTDRDGTRSIFKPSGFFGIPTGTDPLLANQARWLLTQTIDTLGNAVNYSYDCPKQPVCYPREITFGPYKVSFHFEDRPDAILMANGKSISPTDKRLATVSVSINTQTIRAYSFSYELSAITKTSRLKTVQLYGSDAIFASGGKITSGTGRKPTAFTYQNMHFNFTTDVAPIINNGCSNYIPFGYSPYGSGSARFVDLNNDGVVERLTKNTYIKRRTSSDGDDSYQTISFLLESPNGN